MLIYKIDDQRNRESFVIAKKFLENYAQKSGQMGVLIYTYLCCYKSINFEVLAKGYNISPEEIRKALLFLRDNKIIEIGSGKIILKKESSWGKQIKKDIHIEEGAWMSPDDYLNKLLKSPQRHIQIIGVFVKYKNVLLDNKEKYKSVIQRNSPAVLLKGYPNQKIIETMKWMDNNLDFKWTLETVNKYIDEDLEMLTMKQQGISRAMISNS